MKNKGFTLIELLAVIVVLAIIALITTPMIMNVIEKSKKGALEDSAYGLIDAANIYYANNMLEGTIEKVDFTFANGEQTSEQKLSYKGKVESGDVKLFSDGKVALCITEGKYSALKNVNDEKVTVTTGGCEYNEETNTYETIDKTAEELQACLNESSDGKSLIAAAITEKGIATSETDSYEVMANNIKNLSTLQVISFDQKTGNFTLDITQYTDSWAELTSDNFYVILDKATGGLYGDSGGSAWEGTITPVVSYDSTTGALTVTGMVYSKALNDHWRHQLYGYTSKILLYY